MKVTLFSRKGGWMGDEMIKVRYGIGTLSGASVLTYQACILSEKTLTVARPHTPCIILMKLISAPVNETHLHTTRSSTQTIPVHYTSKTHHFSAKSTLRGLPVESGRLLQDLVEDEIVLGEYSTAQRSKFS